MLEIIDLQLSIHKARPLRGIDLRVEEGRSIGVVGESGSGKSLTALTIMGLLPLDAKASGKILWQGRNLLALQENQYRSIRGREIAMIFQDPMSSLNPAFTVGFQIGEVLKHKMGVSDPGERRRRGLNLLKEVGIASPEERWEAYPHQLSGGMSQRVCIAMALACEPRLLIADEPTTALDVTVQAQILTLLSRLVRERKMSMFFVTHDLAVAAKVCDEIAVFYGGMAVEHGPVAEVLKRPHHPYTKALLAARPNQLSSAAGERRPRLVSIPGSVPRSTEQISGCVFATRCNWVTELCRQQKPTTLLLTQFHSSRCILKGDE